MTSFIEERLLDKVAYGFQGGPTYSVTKVPVRSGGHRRKPNRTRPLYRFVAPYKNIQRSDHAEVARVFNAVMGGTYGFRFKDWADFEATDESLGDAPAGTAAVQLIKTYTASVLSTVRQIRKPVTGTVVVEQSDGAGGWDVKPGTTDTTTGEFTPSTSWTEGRALRWSGEFDVPVVFANDELIFDYSNVLTLTGNVALEEDLFA